MANEKETHQPSRIVGYGIAAIMNALDGEGNIVGRKQPSIRYLPVLDRVCGAFPQFVIFLKHESGFGRLDERWGMSDSS
ncbi:hypothetical protein [Rhizobium leguminosarum]|uniref:hypothetical protein n=1 Tax=Rhizobium leguminosarum TaxID=384 RepID=UPI001495DEE2|nr:hypothetical protein [Rhizobium leguminosarum]